MTTKKSTRQPIEGSKKDLRQFMSRGGKLDCSHLKKDYPNELGGKTLRIVNNTDGRVQQMERLGWEVVQLKGYNSNKNVWTPSKTGGDEKQESSVVSFPVGGGVDGILMMKPEEDFRNEERAAFHERAASTEAAMIGGKAPSSARDAGVETYDAGSKMRIGS